MQVFSWGDGATGYVHADGKRLEAASFGPDPGRAPTLILLHEGLGCVALWRDFPRRLVDETGLGVFAFSRAGYGQSDLAELPRPTDYMAFEACHVLPRVLDQIGVRTGVLIGHSDGATIASLHLGYVADPRIAGAVLIAPHYFAEPTGLASIREARSVFQRSDLKDRMARYHKDPVHTFQGWNDVWLSDEFQSWNVSTCIDMWREPALAIQGSDDQYGTLAQIAEIERRARSGVRSCILDDCRHAPHLEKPDDTIRAIVAFLRDSDRTN